LDNIFVVNNLMPHIDRRTISFEGAFDDLDGAHDAGTKAARLSQDDLDIAAVKQVCTSPRQTASTVTHRATFSVGCQPQASVGCQLQASGFRPLL
jgi:hypothetical protein